MAKMSKRKKRKIRRSILLVLVTVFFVAMLVVSPKIVKVMQLAKEAKAYAAGSTISTFQDTKTTMIYDADGNWMCSMRNEKDLYYVNISEIPRTLQKAFIVMEDRDFYNHGGIDYKAIVRAIIVNQRSNAIAQGASTITQQLARNIFLTQEVTWERKIEEIFLAQELEKRYTKDQILEFYLNNIYFGNGYYGVEAAARGYFNKSVAELSLSEQALIAAIPNNPSRNDPFTQLDYVTARRDLVLQELYDMDYINSMHYYTAVAEEIVLEQPVITKNNSVETYARHCATEALMFSSGFLFQYNFDDETQYNAYMDGYYEAYTRCQNRLFAGGYSIYTSINLEMQEKLQKAIDENLQDNTALSEEGVYELQSAGTCMDNTTGYVVAIVGSRSQELAGYTLNRAYQSYRQPGSSIKPIIVYMPYLQRGNTPDTMVEDAPIENGPNNADGTFLGQITLREAVRWSRNTVAWNIYQELTPRIGCSFLLNLGFHNVWMDKEYNAAALGGFTYGVSTEEMAGAYAAICNDGVYRQPTCITSIVNVSGQVVYYGEARTTVKIYDANSCRMMTDMMKTVVESGTGTNANIENAIVAGKTGTTNEDKDAWFCGYSQYYTTTVWLGYDMPRTIAQGGYYATSIWSDFMESAHEGLEKVDFSPYAREEEATTAVPEETSQAASETAESTQAETSAGAEAGTTAPIGEWDATGGNAQEPTTYPVGEWEAETQTDPIAIIPPQG